MAGAPGVARRAPAPTASRAGLGLGWPPAAPDHARAPAASADSVVARTVAPDGPADGIHLHRAAAPPPEPAPDPFDAGAVAVAEGIARRVDPTEVRFAPPGQAAPAPVARAATAVADRAPDTQQQPQTAEIVAAGPAAAPAQDLGALADELWERLELRLRTDLMLERERRGTWPDA